MASVCRKRWHDPVLPSFAASTRACKDAEIVGQTDYRWRKVFGGLKANQARRAERSGAGERESGEESLEVLHLLKGTG
jgi:hypothetical protein